MNHPQVAEKCPAAPSSSPCLPYLPLRRERTSGRGCWRGLTLGWSRGVLRWTHAPKVPTVWGSSAPPPTRSAASFPPGKVGWKRRTADPNSPGHALPGAHLGVAPRLPSPRTQELVLQHLAAAGGRAGWPCMARPREHLGVKTCGAGSLLILTPPAQIQKGWEALNFRLRLPFHSRPNPGGGSSYCFLWGGVPGRVSCRCVGPCGGAPSRSQRGSLRSLLEFGERGCLRWCFFWWRNRWQPHFARHSTLAWLRLPFLSWELFQNQTPFCTILT